MAKGQILRIYLDDKMLRDAKAGQHNFITRIGQAFQSIGYRVDLHKNTEVERLKSLGRRGYALFSMENPFHPNALSFRRNYFYPFWSIEPTVERWNFHVATSEFSAETIDSAAATQFCKQWRKRLFPAANPVSNQGFIYIPLQGKLTRHRSFQSASPIEMIKQTLDCDRNRAIVTTLHPGEKYSAEEIRTLHSLIASNDRLTLHQGSSHPLLSACDYIVTQNSAVALSGYFFAKPAVLFAKSDFHHIAANVPKQGLDKSFTQIQNQGPNFERYLFWFLQQMSINAGRPEAENQILAAARRGGWNL